MTKTMSHGLRGHPGITIVATILMAIFICFGSTAQAEERGSFRITTIDTPGIDVTTPDEIKFCNSALVWTRTAATCSDTPMDGETTGLLSLSMKQGSMAPGLGAPFDLTTTRGYFDFETAMATTRTAAFTYVSPEVLASADDMDADTTLLAADASGVRIRLSEIAEDGWRWDIQRLAA